MVWIEAVLPLSTNKATKHTPAVAGMRKESVFWKHVLNEKC